MGKSSSPKQGKVLPSEYPNSRARRREKRAKRSTEATPLASGSSTPRRKSSEKNIPSSNGITPADSLINGSFEESTDFIPFTFSDSGGESSHEKSKEENGEARNADTGSIRDKGKGKARDGYSPEPGLSEEKSKSRGEKDRQIEREWDRGKRDRGRDDDRHRTKRKHDLLFDFDDGYANKKQRLDASSRKAPWVTGIDWYKCKNVAEMLHAEVEAFVHWISPSPVEDEVRGLIVTQISNIVKASFPDARVLPFGSYETKLYLPLGDIDLVILSDSMAYSNKVNVLYALANTLKRSGVTSHVTIIAKAKVPIVKFVTTHGRFHVDISLNQSNGLLSGKIINGFLKDMHGNGAEGKGSMALRSLVMVTKALLTQRSMNEVYTGGLGSYSIVCLAVSFLQMHPKIRNGEIDPEKNLGVLAMEFFELYGCYFNYDEVGISLRDGGMYFSKRKRGWYDYDRRGILSLEDPADPSNDISKGSYGFHKVRTAFAGAHGILTSTAYLRAGMINARRSGRSVHLRSHDESEDLSILSTVLGITQETINHRKLVQEVYDRRTLHKILGVQPQAIVQVVHAPASTSSFRQMSAPHDSHAWKNLQDYGDDADDDYKHHTWQGDEEEEGGRYDIGRQPPKKRRRTGKLKDTHTVFIPDTDDDEEDGDHFDEEEGDGNSKYDDDRERSRREPDSHRRRSYWLSKGIGFGEGNDDDNYSG